MNEISASVTEAASDGPAPCVSNDESRRPRYPAVAADLSRARKLLISAVAIGLVVLLWFLTGHFGWMSPVLLPSPGEIAETVQDLWTNGYVHVPLWQHVAVSVARALVAFAVAIVSGVPIGLLMGMSPAANAALDPFVQFLRPLPKLALIPLIIVWFGIGELSKFL